MQVIATILAASLLWAATMTQTFYKAFGSNSLTTIEAALDRLESEQSSTTNKAYKGALLMKKSNFLKSAAQKIALFKEGNKYLEAAITKDPSNLEFRFIRLTIQENAPKILKYNKNINEDKSLIIKGYKKMSSRYKAYVLDYAQESTILNVSDLK